LIPPGLPVPLATYIDKGHASLTLFPVSLGGNTVRLRVIKPRVSRLKELVAGLGQDYTRLQEEDNHLLDGELRAYLNAIQQAIARLSDPLACWFLGSVRQG